MQLQLERTRPTCRQSSPNDYYSERSNQCCSDASCCAMIAARRMDVSMDVSMRGVSKRPCSKYVRQTFDAVRKAVSGASTRQHPSLAADRPKQVSTSKATTHAPSDTRMPPLARDIAAVLFMSTGCPTEMSTSSPSNCSSQGETHTYIL